MSLQYIADYAGKPTAVVIPISEWEKLAKKHADLQEFNPPIAEEKHISLMKEFENLLSKEEGNILLQHVEQSRNEWDSENI